MAESATCGSPPHAAAASSPMTLLIQDVDRGLEDIQQTCQYAGDSAGGICLRHVRLARIVDSVIAL